MPDDNSQPAGGEAVSTPSIEDRLGSFDFDATPAAPAQAPADNQEPGDEAQPTETAEAEQSEPEQPEEDSRRVRLRDGTEVEISTLKRAYRPEWERETRDFEQRRRDFEAQQAQVQQQVSALTQHEQQLAKSLDDAVLILQNRMPKAPDRQLLETDPFAYQAQKVAYDDAVQELQQLGLKQQQLNQVAQQRNHQAFQQHIKKQHEMLVTAMPDLKDPAKAAKFWEQAKSYGATVGFTPQEMAQVSDARVLMVLKDAAAWRSFQERQAKLKEKEKAAAPMPPPASAPERRPGPAERERTAVRGQLDRLRKTGSAKDAEAFLSKFD